MNPEKIDYNKKFENTPKVELAPELVKRVENSKIALDDKVNILLTKAGFRPASEINLIIKSEYEGEITEHMDGKDVKEALQIIKELGLPFKLGERKTEQESYYAVEEPEIEKFYQREQQKILIGRTREDLDFLIKAVQSDSNEMLGKAYGFPPTAVEAFTGKRKILNISNLPREIKESDGILFSSPTLSANNWQEEIKQGQRNADFIKSISPTIYKEMRNMSLRRE